MNDLGPIGAASEPVARARDLSGTIAAAADAIEQTRRLPADLLDRLHEARLFRMLLPRSVGGDAVAPGVYAQALAEISRADGSVGWCVSIANSTALLAAYMDLAVARAIWGDPRSTVAWGPRNEARARAAPGGYRLTGRWDFASGCRHATWMGASGYIEEPDGSLRLTKAGRRELLVYLFPATAATLLDTWNAIGLRGTGSDSYEVSDLFVPEAYTGTREDPTARRERGALFAFPQQTLYAIGIAGVALGIARGMLDAFIELACRKAPRGRGRLADDAVVQSEVARAEARLGAARAYLLDTVGSIYARADDIAPIGVPDRARVRLAAAHAVTNAIAVADFGYKAAGTDAIFPGSPFERRFRDIHTLSQQIQSRDAHYEACGQVLLGNPPEDFL